LKSLDEDFDATLASLCDHEAKIDHVLLALKRRNQLNVTERAKSIREDDHVWEVQLWARAMQETEARSVAGFSLAQVCFLVDNVVNAPQNLNTV
jgi:hypothetical protein